MAESNILHELLSPEGVTDKRFAEARRSFWAYCKLMNPKFFKDSRPYQRELCDVFL